MVRHSYYPLINLKDRLTTICVETLFTSEDLTKLKEQLTHVELGSALVGPGPTTDDINEYEKLRIESHNLRKSNISFLSDPSFNWVYEKIAVAVLHVNTINYNKVLYGIEDLQYTEYDSKYNGFYGVHKDSHYYTNDALRRSLSFSMQLSDESEYSGGELKIHDNNTTFIANKSLGSITFFDSNVYHEVTPVQTGFRKSLVGWVLGPRV